MNLSYQAITLFFSLLVTALPWLLLGVMVSSGLLVFSSLQKLVNLCPRNRILGAVIGSFLGLLLPVCQYGNLPVARRFILQGVPLSLTFSFLVAAPTLNPITIWLSQQALPNHPTLHLYRILATWLTAIAVGIIFSFYRDKSLVFDETESLSYTRSTLLKTGTFIDYHLEREETRKNSPLILFLSNFIRESIELVTWLIIGSAIAAIVHTFLPQVQMMQWGRTAFTQIIIMMLLGFLLSLGSPYSSFFLIPVLPNLLPGSIIAFLLFSSVFDLKSTNLFLSIFQPKIVLYLLLLLFFFTLFFSLVFNFYIS